MGDGGAGPRDFDRDVITAPAGTDASQEDMRGIITAIARASHDIADLVSLGRLASSDAAGPASARRILVDGLASRRIRCLSCAGDPEPVPLDDDGLYAVTIDPLEGMPDAEANLPFGTIFSVARANGHITDHDIGPAPICAAGLIHYGPQTNLVFTLGSGVHIFNLDRAARTYRLAAENVRIPDATREWSIDVSKRQRWPASIRALIDEELGEADAPGTAGANVRWTGSLTADAYRILRRGGVYLCPVDEQPGREDTRPDPHHAAYPVAFIIEQAGGHATTGHERLIDLRGKPDAMPTPVIFGSPGIVARIERLHALPEHSFEESPLFRKRGLFHL